jgi:hypothetical protein
MWRGDAGSPAREEPHPVAARIAKINPKMVGLDPKRGGA